MWSPNGNMANPRGYPTCSDLSDIKPLCKKKDLFLKPLVRLNISVQLPKTKSQEYSISNHALMEAVRQMALPDEFCSMKTTKTSVDMVRFEAEVEMPKNILYILSRLDGEPIKLKGYLEQGRVRASLAKNEFPSRHDWDSFFRDAKHMNELKAGERPDTVHVQDLPVDWFVTKSSNGKPCERLICRIFEQFGAISAVDIPSNDPYRSQMGSHISGIRQFNFSTTNLFETYVQYKDYVSFVCAMDALRGMKLLKKNEDQAWTQVLKVDFDKTKHLSETSIRKRKLLREKFMETERQQEEKCQEVVDNVVHTRRPSVEPRRKVREKSETPPSVDEIRKSESPGPSMKKIIREEKLYLVAQRKLESIRLLSELLERIADKKTVGGGARAEKRLKPKALPSVINPVYSGASTTEIKEEPFDSYAGNSYANQQDGGSYNRGYWRGRGQRFQGQRGRGRFQRGRGFFNNQGPGRWENHQNPRDGFSSNHRDGYSRDDYSSNPLQRESSSSRDGHSSRDGFRRHNMDGPRPYFNPRDQMFYNNELQSMYYRYFQGLVHSDSRRSRSRSRSGSRSRRRRHRSRSRSRSHRRSRSRSRSRTRSRSRRRHRSNSRSRDRHHSRSRSRSRSNSRPRSKSRSYSRQRSKSRSRSRPRSKSRSRSRSHSRSRRQKSRSRSRSRSSQMKSKSRSCSWSQRRQRSDSPAKADTSDKQNLSADPAD